MILKPDCLGVDRMSHPPGLEPHTSRAEVGNAYYSATRILLEVTWQIRGRVVADI